VPQKGVDLLKAAIHYAKERQVQFVLLGSSPIPEIQAEFEALKKQFEGSPFISLILRHNEELAHLIYAGADLFLIPSIFEPCGLTQLIAHRYGSIPVVRHTGGLVDTVFDYDRAEKSKGNGFVFQEASALDMQSALDRALDYWHNHPDVWRRLMIQVMHEDHSWKEPAKLYLNLYRRVLKK
jgi:starch synthase